MTKSDIFLMLSIFIPFCIKAQKEIDVVNRDIISHEKKLLIDLSLIDKSGSILSPDSSLKRFHSNEVSNGQIKSEEFFLNYTVLLQAENINGEKKDRESLINSFSLITELYQCINDIQWQEQEARNRAYVEYFLIKKNSISYSLDDDLFTQKALFLEVLKRKITGGSTDVNQMNKLLLLVVELDKTISNFFVLNSVMSFGEMCFLNQ